MSFPSELRCAHCGHTFDPDEARGVEVIGPSTALYRCPRCGRFERSIPPQDGSTESRTLATDGGRSRDELKFSPHLTVEVPRASFEAALDQAGVEQDVDDVSPYTPVNEPDTVETALFDHYSPTFTWVVVDEE